MMAVRSDASIRMMHVCNTQICSNARKSIWKQSPQTVFKVKGRELKLKPAKSSLVDISATTPTSANQPQFASAMHHNETSERFVNQPQFASAIRRNEPSQLFANQPQFASVINRIDPSEFDDDSSSGISTAFPNSSDMEDEDIDLDITIPFEK